jgi:hypothetical protein
MKEPPAVLEVKLPFSVVEQLQTRSRAAGRNTAEEVAGVFTRQTSEALTKAVFRSTKLAVETLEARARATPCECAGAALLDAAAALAEGSHFNGATLLGTGHAEKEPAE